MAQRRKGREDVIFALLFPIFCPFIPALYPVIPAKSGIHRPTTSSSRKRGQARRAKSSMNRERQVPSPFTGLQMQVANFVFLSKVGAPRGCGEGKPSPPREIRYELQPADPLSLYGLAEAGCEFRLSIEGRSA